jgi:2-oxoisovalerate dehydrogenase E1 component
MAVSRTAVVDATFRNWVQALVPGAPRADLDAPVRGDSRLSAREALRLFEAQVESRILDLVARELKNAGEGFYTIGSSGHEGNAAVAAAVRPDDPAFLHYRSGAFYLARASAVPGAHGAMDIMLGLCSSADEPIAGGRHKVFGSLPLNIPPQTSTIASHLPKAVGCAVSLDRRARLVRDSVDAEDRIVVCTFGDASSNHSTAQGAFNAAAWTSFQNVPAPVLFVCEDNGIGISVRTPQGWVGSQFRHRPDLKYFYGDGLELDQAYDAAIEAADYVRSTRKPAFLHLRTVRLMGHAGSDVEQTYRTPEEIASGEALDPLLRSAALVVEQGWMSREAVLALYDDTQARIDALGREAKLRPKLKTREEVMAPLFRHDAHTVAAAVPTATDDDARKAVLGELPEASDRPRHLAFQINRALGELLHLHPEAILFGEDVARKGGVYNVTTELWRRFGNARVFNTLLDEQSILGLAIGAGHAGLLPIPEIQYLAYLINAVDQLRGEAGSMQFFSNGQYANPMVVRIAGLAYQKGFGGHFHNDNGIAAVREIPGVLFGCPSRGDDAVRMLRTMTAAARVHGRTTLFLEPIALYMTRDLYAPGDNLWQTLYPALGESLPVDEVGVYGADDPHLVVATFANGLWMSLRVAKRLEAEGIRVRVLDLRWLQPLPLAAVLAHAQACGKLLVVDECRRSSGIADAIAAWCAEHGGVTVSTLTGADTYIPLGDAANLVLVQESEIEASIRSALETR